MTKVSIGDVDRLRPQLGSRSIQDETTAEQEGTRRGYVRAVFALIEATAEQHKRLVQDLASRQAIALEEGAKAVLTEQAFVADDKGKVSNREQYLKAAPKDPIGLRRCSECFRRGSHCPVRRSGLAAIHECNRDS